MSKIELNNIKKNYKKKTVLDNINLQINEGEFFCLLGPSGSGKTTLLNIISGLTEPTDGKILFNDIDVSKIESFKRGATVVFQDYSLFPHMTIFENIEFGLKMKKVNKKERIKLVNEMLNLIQLKDKSNSLPKELSGAQKQRVAIARSIITKPNVLLLDEPFSGLDTNTKINMIDFISRTIKEHKITTIMVTHDKSDAYALSDKIGIMIDGDISQVDTPKNIFQNPNSTALAKFLGNINILKGNVNNGILSTNICSVSTDKNNGIYDIGIRYSDIITTNDTEAIKGHIVKKIFLGNKNIYQIKVNDELIFAELDNDFEFNEYDQINIDIKKFMIFDK